jgi:hypothetical protein
MNATHEPMPAPSGAESNTGTEAPTPAHPLFAAAATVLSAAIRLFPTIKPPNFAPPGALGLYGGARAPLWQALLMTVGAMAVSDVLLQKMFAWPWFNPWVYGCMIGYVFLGRALLRKTKSAWKIGGATLLGSTVFYLVTNFGSWYGGLDKPTAMYAPTTAGLIDCYVRALPYFGFTLAGDLGFAYVLFGAHAWLAEFAKARGRAPQREVAK